MTAGMTQNLRDSGLSNPDSVCMALTLSSICNFFLGRLTNQRRHWNDASFMQDNERIPDLHLPLQLDATDFIKGCLTCASAHVFCHDSTEVPEARLTAVALLSPNTGLTGALASVGITCALVGAVDVTLTGT